MRFGQPKQNIRTPFGDALWWIAICIGVVLCFTTLVAILTGCNMFAGAIKGAVKDITGATEELAPVLLGEEDGGLIGTLGETLLGGGVLGGVFAALRAHLKKKKQQQVSQVLSRGLYQAKIEPDKIEQITDGVGEEARALGVKREMDTLYEQTKG